MIAIVPVRFETNTDASSVWSEEVFHNWMQPLRRNSLANFWWLSSRGLFPLDYTLYDPIVVKASAPQTPKERPDFESAVIAAATAQVNPDWAGADIVLLWFAQPTGWWGGSSVKITLASGATHEVKVTVIDLVTPFDAACQELGHSFGLSHEILADGMDQLKEGQNYASPYSVMSARAYGGTGGTLPEFLRLPDKDLPDGGKNHENPFLTIPAQRILGPRLPAAQLYAWAGFRDSPSVIHLNGEYAREPVVVRLYALNYQLTEPPGPLPVLLSLPSNRHDGRTFLVELRRGGFDYDAGIGTFDDDGNPLSPFAGLVVHSRNFDGSIRYEGVADLGLAASMTDWASGSGDFALRLLRVGPGNEFVDVAVRGGGVKSFPIRGVLLAGRFRTQQQLNAMTYDDMRNTLIVEMTRHSNQTNYQGYDNDALAGVGAVMVFLRETKIRDDAALSKMSADDQRNTLIVEIDAQTGVGRDLQALSNLDLVLVGLGSDRATRGRAPGVVSSFIRGILLAGHFRTQHELNAMSRDDMRNTLIVEMTGHSNQTNYQGYNDAELEGMGAVMVLLRELKIRDDAALRTMSADDQRNTLIVELDAQTGLGRKLQGFTNMQLVLTALGVEPAVP